MSAPTDPPLTSHFRPGSAWYYRKQQHVAAMIPVAVAMIGFVAYGSWKLEEPWNVTLICLSVPVLWLVLGLGSYLRYGRLARSVSEEEV